MCTRFAFVLLDANTAMPISDCKHRCSRCEPNHCTALHAPSASAGYAGSSAHTMIGMSLPLAHICSAHLAQIQGCTNG